MSSHYVYNIAPSRFQPGSRSALPAAAPQAPTVARKQRVKKRNLGMSARLPEGYAFIPPANPLVFPSTYHLIEAGPMHERPRRKRSVLGVLTNAVLPKRKEPKVIDPVMKEWLSQATTTVLGSGCGRYFNLGCEMVAESGFASSRIRLDWRYAWWRRWAAGRFSSARIQTSSHASWILVIRRVVALDCWSVQCRWNFSFSLSRSHL
ncbi:hypothetical protein R3P38DRAFT_3340260 [Favolaschia claudopus]|uniref:Uncharacterized protein n=1 Tax=Favolaschia claudopus TaxID=2862362 RepID=A0AAW0EAJ9_9AGAR